MERCTRCILPTTYPGITFNEKGICSFCMGFKEPDPIAERGREEELKQLVEKARLSRGRYQAIVPISGGKDSAYVLYVMRRLYGLRTLAVNFDNGFRSSAAETNLKTLTTRLGVDYISIKPNWDLMRNLYAAFVKITGEFCTVCNAMGYLTMMSLIAMEGQKQAGSDNKILVAGGWSKDFEAMPGMYSFDFKYFCDVIAEAGMLESLRSSAMVNEQCLDFLMSAPDPRATVKAEILPFNYIMLPDYISWNSNQISKTLKEEVGWVAPVDEPHFDCIMYPVAKYFELKKYGFSQNTVTYSALVRANQMDRREALRKVEEESREAPPRFIQFLDMLGLAETEVNWNGKWHPQRQ